MNSFFKKLDIPKTEIRTFILTLIATLIGVFCAISLTNLGMRNKEKEDTIKLLSTSKSLLQNTKAYGENLVAVIKTIEADTTAAGIARIMKVKEMNPLPYPVLFESIVTNETIAKNISAYTHGQIFNLLLNLKKTANYETYSKYEKLLTFLILLIDLELQYQNNALSVSEIKSKMSQELDKLGAQEKDNKILEFKSKY